MTLVRNYGHALHSSSGCHCLDAARASKRGIDNKASLEIGFFGHPEPFAAISKKDHVALDRVVACVDGQALISAGGIIIHFQSQSPSESVSGLDISDRVSTWKSLAGKNATRC